MKIRPSKRVFWAGAVGIAYSGVVVLAYAVGPGATAGCSVAGHGRITAASGDRASFSGLSVSAPPRGAEFYRDNGPSNALRMRSLSVVAVTCNTDATKASILGTASINGSGSIRYGIDIRLAPSQRGNDTYGIRLANGYATGVQAIRHGDVVIHLGHSEHRHRDPDANQNQGGQQDGS
jgi:hypothetical protein